MAVRTAQLGTFRFAPGTAVTTTLLTVPAGMTAIIKEILSHADNGTCTFSYEVIRDAGPIAIQLNVLSSGQVSAPTPRFTVLEPGDVLRVRFPAVGAGTSPGGWVSGALLAGVAE